jgi:hypothetical protein
MYKLIGADQKEYGPITADQLRQWISEGRVNAQSRVLPEGATEWRTMADLPEFAAILPRPAPPLPRIAPIAPLPSSGGTSQMAVWALITGIMSIVCCWTGLGTIVLGPVSIVLGAVALAQLKQHPEKRGAGFAIAGIALGVLALLILVTMVVVFISNPSLIQNLQNAVQPP